MRIKYRNAIILVGILLAGTPTVQSDDWPSFRGPRGNGVSEEATVVRTWSATENVKWKVALPRPGNGSPIVSEGAVFVTSAEDADGRQRTLYCFDRHDGSLRWHRTARIDEKMPTHTTNPYCGSTPVANGQRVVVWHASAGLYCYDFAGKEIWSRDLGQFKHMWGYGTSPILYGDSVILHCGPGERIVVTALDLATGKTIWETDEPHQGDGQARGDGKYMGSWVTPVVAQMDGKDQIICALPTRVVAYDPRDGRQIWVCDGIRGPKGDLAYSSPILADGICVVVGGFQGPSIGVRLGGTGNVTATRRLWRKESNPQSIGTAVHRDGYLFRPNAGPGTIDCLDPRTGDVLWTERGTGASHWASIVIAAGHCYATGQDGATVVFRPDPRKCEIIATNELGEPTNSTPAVSNGEIFIRTFDHLFCLAAAAGAS